MKKVKRKQIDFGGNENQVVRGNGELGDYNDTLLVKISTIAPKGIKKIVSEDLQCDRTPKEIITAVLEHRGVDWIFLYEDGTPATKITPYPLIVHKINTDMFGDSTLGYEFFYDCTLYHIDNINNKQITIRCYIRDIYYPDDPDINETSITFSWYYTDIRTINNEPTIVDPRANISGNVNLHDGFYFPNAVQDNDGNWYDGVVLGNQVWLAQNLRTKSFNDGTPIEEGDSLSETPAYQDKSSSNIPFKYRGLFYNWYAILNGSTPNNNVPSNIQGLAPSGFHIPSLSEYEQLDIYLSQQNRYKTKGWGFESIKCIASVNYWSQWNSTHGGIAPGYESYLNNKTGFSAIPTGLLNENEGSGFYLWTCTNSTEEDKAVYIYGIDSKRGQTVARYVISQDTGATHNTFLPVRCVSDLNPVQFRNWYIQQYGSLQHHLPEEVQVQTDWNQEDNTKIDYIKNKPIIDSYIVEFYSSTSHITDTQTETLTCNRTADEIVDAVKAGKKLQYYVRFVDDGRYHYQRLCESEVGTSVSAAGTNSESYYYGVVLYANVYNQIYEVYLEALSNKPEASSPSSLSVEAQCGNAFNQADWNQTNNTLPDYIKNKPTSVSDFDLYLITITESENSGVYSYTCDKTAKEIIENVYDNGKTPVYLFSGRAFQNLGKVVLSQSSAAKSSNESYKLYTCDLHLINKQGSTNRFLKLSLTARHYSADETNNTLDIVGTYDDLAADWNESDTSSLAYIKNKPDIDKILYCTVLTRDNQTNEVTINKSVTEINDAVNTGKAVLLKDGDAIYQLNWKNQDPIFVNIYGLYIYIISYNHLSQKWQFTTTQIASSGSVNDGVLTIQKNGTTIDTFSANAASNKTINITVPTSAGDVNAISSSDKGAANGVAELDTNGKVPAAQLPSYVDDVLEYSSLTNFPATGESGKIYVAVDTNVTYRWGGSAYVEISESLALGETSSTAYAGNKGKANADAIAAIKDGTSIDSFGDVEAALPAATQLLPTVTSSDNGKILIVDNGVWTAAAVPVADNILF